MSTVEPRETTFSTLLATMALTLISPPSSVLVNPSEKKYKCPSCPKSFAWKTSRSRHIKKIHHDLNHNLVHNNHKENYISNEVVEKTFFHCRFTCLYRHSLQEVVQRHEEEQHVSEKSAIDRYKKSLLTHVVCPLCFSSGPLDVVRRHQEEQHDLDAKPFRCPDCPFVAERYGDQLDEHRREVHGDVRDDEVPDGDDDNYDVFDRYRNGFVNFAEKWPKFDEEGRKLFYCEFCGFCSAKSAVVGRHKGMSHGRARKFFCFQCSYKCWSRNQLVAHHKDKHAKSCKNSKK